MLSRPFTIANVRLGGLWLVLLLATSATALSQLQRTGQGSRQQLPQNDTASRQEVLVTTLPDSIVLRTYNPKFPVRYGYVPDSQLTLNYVRYDPIRGGSPDYVYLNGLGQPAALNPILGTPYQTFRQTTQTQHPYYREQEAPFFALNVPFSYAAYDQGGEINDGQIKVLFGRPFAKGWGVGLRYNRIYHGGERNLYPRSRAERINFGISLARAPDSSRHRSYAWVDLNSYSHNDPGGYAASVNDTLDFPDDPFEAIPQYVGMRTQGRFSSYNLLHRVFLRKQNDSLARGFAASLAATYRQASHVTSTQSPEDLVVLDAFNVDDRGIRYDYRERGVLAEANLEHFADATQSNSLNLDFRLGAYAGTQSFDASYLPDGKQRDLLLGLKGRVRGEVLQQFVLDADADLALGDRAGQGKVTGSLSWTYRQQFELSGELLLERSAAPWAAAVIGVNDRLVYTADLPVSTHTRVGGAARYAPLDWQVRGYLDVFADATVYDAEGQPRNISSELAIPTLELTIPLSLGAFRMDNSGVLRNPVRTSDARLPGYTGRHTLYARTNLFASAMQLIGGVEAHLRSPAPLYGYFPLTGVFTLDDRQPSNIGWQYSADLFVAVRVKVFKAFVRADNILASTADLQPSTVYAYPALRPPLVAGQGAYLRLGVAFSLLD